VAKDAAKTTTTDAEASPAAADVTTRRQRNVTAGEAVAGEARKGYGLLMIGVDETAGAEGGFHGELTRLAAGFDGPLAVVVARGANRRDPVASGLDILVPVTGTQETRRALDVALALARAGTAPVTLMHVVPESDAWRGGLATRLRQADGEVLKEAVGIAEHYQIETRLVFRRGMSVDHAIIDQLQRGRHDLVVLGVRARTGETLFFGKVAAEVIERSPASVMLISG
jgi:nucleotide-binding universal stress UspA family protein